MTVVGNSAYRDSLGISPKLCNIVVYPFDGEPLVQKTKVLVRVGRSWKSKYIGPVVERYDYHVLLGREKLAIVDGEIGASIVKA